MTIEEEEFESYEGFEEDDLLDAKPPFWWPIAAAFDVSLTLAGEFLSNSVEYAEWSFYFILDFLLFIVMPWRWFRNERPVSPAEDLENFEQVDDVANPALKRLGQVRDSIADNTLGRVIYFGFVAWDKMAELAERLLPRRIFGLLFWLGYVMLDAAFACLDFVAEWWYSRYFPKLRWAAPAMLLGLSVVGVTALGFLNSGTKTIRRYRTSLVKAEEAKDAETAILLKQKLEQLGFEELGVVEYKAALAVAKAGDRQEAYAMMQQLAPRDQSGLLQAHLWIAKALLDGFETEEDEWQLLESHLDSAQTLSKDNVLAKRMRVELLLHQDKIDEAVASMEELSGSFPSLHAALAHEYHSRGEIPQARAHARKAIRHYETMLEKHRQVDGSSLQADSGDSIADELIPTKDRLLDEKSENLLTPTGYLRIAEAFHLLDDFEAEQELLESAVTQHPDFKALSETLRRFYLAQLEKKSDVAASGCGELIEKLARIDLSEDAVVDKLVRGIVAERWDSTASGNVTAKAAWEIVNKLQDQGLLDSRVFQFAGDYHLIDGDFKKAIEFYARTCRLDPQASFAWNNLASVWSSHEPLNIPEALKAANRAIKLNPDPRFYDTRGQIHIRLKQWALAIEDLEMAISGTIPNAIDAHRSLVMAYEAVGKPEQSTAHRKMLDLLVRQKGAASE